MFFQGAILIVFYQQVIKTDRLIQMIKLSMTYVKTNLIKKIDLKSNIPFNETTAKKDCMNWLLCLKKCKVAVYYQITGDVITVSRKK